MYGMTEYLTTTTYGSCQAQGQTAEASRWRAWARQSQGHKEDQFTSASEDDWLEGECGLQANPRHRLEDKRRV